MRLLFFVLLVSSACSGQLKYEWVKSIKLDSTNANGSIFYAFVSNKIYLLNVHEFYQSKINNNADGSITWSFGIKKSNDSLQKATVYEVGEKNKLILQNQFEFNPRYQIKQFIVSDKHKYFVYGAEMYLFGKKECFIKELEKDHSSPDFLFSAESSSNTRLVFDNKSHIGVVAYQYSHHLNHPIFYTIDLKEKKITNCFPDSLRLDNFFQTAYSDEEYYIAGNCRIHTDSADKSSMYSRLLVFDKNGRLKQDNPFQLDDSLHYFDTRSLSVLNGEAAITGLLYSRDYKNQERSWVVQSIKNGERQWIDTLPENYMPQSVHKAGSSVIVVALSGTKPGRGYINYHLLRYTNGQLIENFILDNIQPKWKNINVIHVSQDSFIFSGINIFNSQVVEKISF